MVRSSNLRCLVFSAALTAASVCSAVAAEPIPSGAELLSDQDVVTVELAQPMHFWNHPLVRAIRENAAKSRQVQAALSSPQFDRVRFVQQLLETAGGERWDASLEKLTAGGIAFSATPGNNGKGGLTLVITANNAATLNRFVDGLKEQVESRLPAAQRGKLYRPAKKNGHDFVRVGQAAYAIIGRQLVIGSTEERLLAALMKRQAAKKTESKTSASPRLRVSVDVKRIRQMPNVQKGLKIPGNDAGQLAIFGGWIDLFRRSDRLTVDITPHGDRLEITAHSSAGRKGITPGLEHYFADGKQTTIAPLLKLPETIYAASWYRDYRSLWNARAKLVAAKPLQKLEEGDETIRKQLSVIGAKSAPSRAFTLLGPHFRVAVARQTDSEYRLDLAGRLPAAALCVDVRDESAFRSDVLPFLRGVSFILAVGEQKMITRKTNYKGAVLASIRFRDDPASAEKGNRVRFNFSPTYAVTRGHFIAATSETMVQRVIDELDRQSKAGAKPITGATEVQRLSLTNAAVAVRDIKSSLISAGVFDGGLSVDEASAEIDLFANILQAIGEVTADAGIQPDGFRYRIRIGRRNNSTGNRQP